jgi:sugar lactone lactonase YvrE
MPVRHLPEAELHVDGRAILGEGPVWDERIGRVLWVDIEGRRLHGTDPRDGATSSFEMPEAIGICVPRLSGGYVAALESGFYAVADDGQVEPLVRVDTRTDGLRFNDGACDPQGRFWAGTMAWDHESHPAAGSLYRLDADLNLTRVLENVTISNGLGWSPDGTTMYYVDTPTMRIDAFDFDPQTGTPSRRRKFARLKGPGRPDGICVDVDGAVWVATWPGWSVERYLPDGSLDAVIPLPVAQVSSCVFGGPGLDQLFITTASVGLSAADLDAQPLAGGLFRANPGVHGLPRASFAG